MNYILEIFKYISYNITMPKNILIGGKING